MLLRRVFGGLAALALGALGCGDGGSSTTDAAVCEPPAAVMGRVPYFECAAEGVCPRSRVRTDPMRPAWRVTYLRLVAPEALAVAAVEGAVNPRLQNGNFLWALSLDLAVGSLRTGALDPATRQLGTTGLGLLDGQFRFFNNSATGTGDPGRYNPVTASLTVTRDRVTTTAAAGTLRLPVFNHDGSLFTELPLTGFRMTDVRLTSDRGCVGEGRPQDGRFAEHTSAWNTVDDEGNPYGTMDADISAAAARTVSVTLGGTVVPLCDLLARASCAMPMEMWPKQPDTMVEGMPAWHLRGTFAAVTVDLRQ